MGDILQERIDRVLTDANQVSETLKVQGDTNNRFQRRTSGLQEWGSGSATPDTNLYRDSANTLKSDDVVAAALGFKDTVNSYTTTGALVAYGVAVLAATAATTYNLPDPTIGVPIRIASNTTHAQTIVMSTTNGVKFNSTGVSIAFNGKDAAVHLMPSSATRWEIISSYSTGVAFA